MGTGLIGDSDTGGLLMPLPPGQDVKVTLAC